MADSPKKAASAAPPKVERASEAPDVMTGIQEPKLPSRKDTSLKEFLGKMDDYAPIVSSPQSFRPNRYHAICPVAIQTRRKQ